METKSKKESQKLEEAIKLAMKPATTNILKRVKFASKQDEHVFRRLPISDFEKERLLFDLAEATKVEELCPSSSCSESPVEP